MNSVPEQPKVVFGVITPDPVSKVAIGAQINFPVFMPVHETNSSFNCVENWGFSGGAVLSVGFRSADKVWIEGSAVMVAPGVAIAAKHVIEPRFGELMDSNVAMHCYGVLQDSLRVWRVSKITYLPSSDLALLGLDLLTEISGGGALPQAAITTRLPKVGEKLMLLGFRASEAQFEVLANNVAQNLIVCWGTVAQRYELGRDSAMIPWPVVEVNCPSWGGMSGGPAFDSSGHLIGVLSSSFSTDDNNGPSYVSLIFPSLTMRFEGGWPASFFNQPRTLLEMSPQGCHIQKKEAFKQVVNPASGVAEWTYSPWE